MKEMSLALVFSLALPSLARAGNPWEELMGPGKPRLWTDPAARFYLDLPIGWSPSARKQQTSVVDFWKTHEDDGYVAHVTVEMRTVPPDVKTAHFAFRVTDETKAKAHGYRLLEEDRIEVSGTQAYRKHFTYQERKNTELTNEVVQVVFLVGERAFIVSLETALGARGVFWEDFEKMVKAFVGRSPGGESEPLPKERKRIRAGEMVNPDALKY